MGKRRDMTYWNVPVPKPLNDALEKAIMQDWHPTKADFIRDAVREKLVNMGISPPVEQRKEVKECEP